jgi:hypothetical protein
VGAGTTYGSGTRYRSRTRKGSGTRYRSGTRYGSGTIYRSGSRKNVSYRLARKIQGLNHFKNYSVKFGFLRLRNSSWNIFYWKLA